MTRTSSLVFFAFFLMIAFAAPGCTRCSGEVGDKVAAEQGAAGKKRKKKPRHKKDNRRKARPRGAAKTGAELLYVRFETVLGTVMTVAHENEAERPAKPNDSVFAGGLVATGEASKAVLAVREVGMATLDQNALMITAPYTRCGADLVRGSAYIEGPIRTQQRAPCYLHTPSAAILVTQAKAVVAVADDGRVKVAALEGPVTLANLEGTKSELPAGRELVIDAKGTMGKAVPAAKCEGAPEQCLRAWLAKPALPDAQKPKKASDAVAAAEKIADALPADVQALIALQEAHKTLGAEHMAADRRADAGAAQEDPLAQKLRDDAMRMMGLTDRASIRIHRVSSLLALAARLAPADAKIAERIVAARQKMDAMKGSFPALFDRAKQGAMVMGGANTPIPSVPMAGPTR
ncbi:MAG: hypothetical protein PHU25_08715 [Deltaproteobacteria bacterium]|nr:hypothetical protein [Deltaproteobacteria bacterium]